MPSKKHCPIVSSNFNFGFHIQCCWVLFFEPLNGIMVVLCSDIWQTYEVTPISFALDGKIYSNPTQEELVTREGLSNEPRGAAMRQTRKNFLC